MNAARDAAFAIDTANASGQDDAPHFIDLMTPVELERYELWLADQHAAIERRRERARAAAGDGSPF